MKWARNLRVWYPPAPYILLIVLQCYWLRSLCCALLPVWHRLILSTSMGRYITISFSLFLMDISIVSDLLLLPTVLQRVVLSLHTGVQLSYAPSSGIASHRVALFYSYLIASFFSKMLSLLKLPEQPWSSFLSLHLFRYWHCRGFELKPLGEWSDIFLLFKFSWFSLVERLASFHVFMDHGEFWDCELPIPWH